MKHSASVIPRGSHLESGLIQCHRCYRSAKKNQKYVYNINTGCVANAWFMPQMQLNSQHCVHTALQIACVVLYYIVRFCTSSVANTNMH